MHMKLDMINHTLLNLTQKFLTKFEELGGLFYFVMDLRDLYFLYILNTNIRVTPLRDYILL